MAEDIIRFTNGTIARDGAGNILLLDLSSAPASLTLTHNWLAGITGVWTPTISPKDPVASSIVGTIAYYSLDYTWHNNYLGNDNTVREIFSVQLVLGSGSVRWSGTFDVTCRYSQISGTAARIKANIHMNCAAGSVNPRGTYVIDSYTINTPSGSYNAYVTARTSIVLS